MQQREQRLDPRRRQREMEFHFGDARCGGSVGEARALGQRRVERVGDQRASAAARLRRGRRRCEAELAQRRRRAARLARRRHVVAPVAPRGEVDVFERGVQRVAEARAGEARRRRGDAPASARRRRRSASARERRRCEPASRGSCEKLRPTSRVEHARARRRRQARRRGASRRHGGRGVGGDGGRAARSVEPRRAARCQLRPRALAEQQPPSADFASFERRRRQTTSRAARGSGRRRAGAPVRRAPRASARHGVVPGGVVAG